ncbi:hypothetical protein C7212DRAFT_310379, partial [Tuber magnatum]
MGVNDSFKGVKGVGDFGKWVVGEEEKEREIIRGLGKREERDQEQEGFWERVELEEEEVEECRKKQGNRKAAGEDEIGGKVWKEIWEEGKGRKIEYVPKQFRSVLGVVIRKLRKEDYGKPE